MKKQKKRKEAEESIERSLFFPTRQRAMIYKEKFENKDVLKGRRENFLEFPFGRWLKTLGLTDFVSVEETIYPRLVRMFYCNITDGNKNNETNSEDDPNTFTKTYVKGVEIPLSPAMLNEVFGIIYDPDMITVRVEKEEIYPILSKNTRVGKDLKRMASKYLQTMNMRLLHYMTVYNLFPRAGSYTEVAGGDALLLFAHVQGEDFSFPIQIIIHMLRCRYRKKAPLPYGMAITKILKHYGVDVSGEEKIKYKKADTIDINVMSRLGYVFDEDEKVWVEKQATQEHSESDDNNREDEDDDHRGEDEASDGKHEGGEDNVEHQPPTHEEHHQGSPYGLEGFTPINPPQLERWNELKQSLMDHISQCFSSYQALMSLDVIATPSTIPTTKQVTPSSPTSMPTPMEQVTLSSPTSMPTPTEQVTPSFSTFMPTPMEQVTPNSPTSMPTPTELVTPNIVCPRPFTPFSGFSLANSKVSSFSSTSLMSSMKKLKSTTEHFFTRMEARMDGFEKQLLDLQITLANREPKNGGASTSKDGES